VVPVSALRQQDGRPGVLAVRGGRAMFQAVETGPSDARNVLVRKGIRSGELVVRDAVDVKPGSRVRVKSGE